VWHRPPSRSSASFFLCSRVRHRTGERVASAVVSNLLQVLLAVLLGEKAAQLRSSVTEQLCEGRGSCDYTQPRITLGLIRREGFRSAHRSSA
jgi:hypothetical protein